MLRFVLVGLFGSFFWTKTTLATDYVHSCRNLIKSISHPLLDNYDLAMIETYFSDPSLSASAAAELAFNDYSKVRLALLPDEIRTRVEALLRDRVFKERTDVLMNGFYSPRESSIGTVGSDRYRGSILEFGFLAHEMEHAIHHFLTGEGGSNRFAKGRLNREFRYLEELGAMSAEWQYYRAIPEKDRRSMIQLIKKDTSLSEARKETALRFLKNANLPLKEYIKAEHAAWRYSRSSLLFREVINDINLKVQTLHNQYPWKLFLASTTLAYVLYKSCLSPPSNPPEWFRELCNRGY